MSPLFAFILDSPVMMLILGALAVLLFGERLPEVARSFGKQFMELKSGVRGLQRDLEDAINSATTVDTTPQYQEPEQREEATAPKFEPPPSS
jgi:sec-independent protein translocase protein TatA